MSRHYRPLTRVEIDLIGGRAVPNWTGPALPHPAGGAGFGEFMDSLDRLVARKEALIQAQDGLSREYTLGGVTAPAERFLLGTAEQVQESADLRGLLMLIESFLGRSSPSVPSEALGVLNALRGRLERWAPRRTGHPPANGASAPDLSALALEDVRQFAMAWTTQGDLFRRGYPHVGTYAAAVEDPREATRQFWPTLRGSGLPYNLLVLQKLTPASAGAYRLRFGGAWLPAHDELLEAGRLFGIDLTVFTGLAPHELPNGTVRFTPNTMTLLAMDPDRTLNPVAVYVADPLREEAAQVYTPDSPAWVYALLAAKTSLTVYGIWLGHVYPLHLVTAAVQMATWNELPASHVVRQLLAPHSSFTVPFDLILLLGWSRLAPPTSIGDPGTFLTLCARFAATQSFFSQDPPRRLADLNLGAEDFTDPRADGGPWNLYPNVQRMRAVWTLTEEYVSAVVRAAYPDDAAVAGDADLARWRGAAGDPAGGNVVGLPRLDSRAALQDVLTSLLYRVVFHGLGRLRGVAGPDLTFAPNYPPCLQSSVLPGPQDPLPVAELLNTYLPRTGTLGELLSFYDVFAFTAPYVPLIPETGPGDELFFGGFGGAAAANAALIRFREGVGALLRDLQPDWVHIGQWPRNVEL